MNTEAWLLMVEAKNVIWIDLDLSEGVYSRKTRNSLQQVLIETCAFIEAGK